MFWILTLSALALIVWLRYSQMDSELPDRWARDTMDFMFVVGIVLIMMGVYL